VSSLDPKARQAKQGSYNLATISESISVEAIGGVLESIHRLGENYTFSHQAATACGAADARLSLGGALCSPVSQLENQVTEVADVLDAAQADNFRHGGGA